MRQAEYSEMTCPEIFIITPCRNAFSTIDETIWSVISQAGNMIIHYHVQDGCSTDGTVRKLELWEEKLQSLKGLPNQLYFTWKSEKDDGHYHAIARSVETMNIPPQAFMGWINADDVLLPGALEAVSRFSRDQPDASWLTGYHTTRDAVGAITRMALNAFFPREVLAAGLADGKLWPFMQQESTFWRKWLYDASGGLNTALALAADWDLWRRFAGYADLIHMRRQLGAFTVRPLQLSEDKAKYAAEVDMIRLGKTSLRHGGKLGKRGWFSIQEARQNNGDWQITQTYMQSKKPKIWYILHKASTCFRGRHS